MERECWFWGGNAGGGYRAVAVSLTKSESQRGARLGRPCLALSRNERGVKKKSRWSRARCYPALGH